MQAVIQTGSKQYRVAVGDRVEVEKLDQTPGDRVSFPVLMIEDGTVVKVGRPHLAGATVTAEVLEQKKDKKVIAYTYRRRKSSERKVGHRQPLTLVKIMEIKA